MDTFTVNLVLAYHRNTGQLLVEFLKKPVAKTNPIDDHTSAPSG